MKNFHLSLLLTLFFLLTSINLVAQTNSDMQLSQHFRLLGGLSLPIGDFGATSGAHAGLAKSGFSLGAEYSNEDSNGFELGLLGCYSINSIDEAEIEKQFLSAFESGTVSAGSWSLLNLMGSVGFISKSSPNMSIYGKGYAGLLIGTIPEITIDVSGTTITQESATATAIGYGIGGGLLINEKIDIGVRYLTGEPEYEEKISTTGGGSATVKVKIPNGTVQLIVGLVL
jgi:hypothetical protein